MAKHPKYINPATDFGFKKIFKDEEITRGFLIMYSLHCSSLS